MALIKNRQAIEAHQLTHFWGGQINITTNDDHVKSIFFDQILDRLRLTAAYLRVIDDSDCRSGIMNILLT